MIEPQDYRRSLCALLARPLFRKGNHAVNPGWIGIAERLADAVEALPRSGTVRCSQCGEKFGFWKVYLVFDVSDRDMREALAGPMREVEAESSRTCLVCGEPGEIVQVCDDFRHLALCPEHAGLPRDEISALLRPLVEALKQGEAGDGKPV